MAVLDDGVNDTLAITRAGVAIVIDSGTDVAVESPGIILMKSDGLDVVKIIDLCQPSYRKLVQKLAWATGYNMVVLPLAVVAINDQLRRRQPLEVRVAPPLLF
jgi:Cu2+-exporting ATPase